jgi:hypothetical protein
MMHFLFSKTAHAESVRERRMIGFASAPTGPEKPTDTAGIPEAKTLANYIAEIETEIPEGEKAVKAMILDFIQNDGEASKDEIQKLAGTIQSRLMNNKDVSKKSVAELQALMSQLPQAGNSLLRYAMDNGILSDDQVLDGIRRGMENKGTVPSSEPMKAVLPGGKIEKAPELSVEQIVAKLAEIKEGLEEINSQKRLVITGARSQMRNRGRQELLKARVAMGQQMVDVRTQQKKLLSEYRIYRAMYEEKTGMSYARLMRQELYGEDPALAKTREEARKIIVVDEATGKSLGSYDEFTGNYIGRMPKEQVIGLAMQMQDVDSATGAVIIKVDGSQYLNKPAEPRPSLRGRRDPLLAGMSDAAASPITLNEYMRRMDNDRRNSPGGVRNGISTQQGYMEMAIAGASREGLFGYVQGNSSVYIDRTGKDRAYYDSLSGGSAGMGSGSNSVPSSPYRSNYPARQRTLDTNYRKIQDQLSYNNDIGGNTLKEYTFNASRSLDENNNIVIKLPVDANNPNGDRIILINDPRDWMDTGVFGSKDTTLARENGIRVVPEKYDIGDGGGVRRMRVQFTKPGTYEVEGKMVTVDPEEAPTPSDRPAPKSEARNRLAVALKFDTAIDIERSLRENFPSLTTEEAKIYAEFSHAVKNDKSDKTGKDKIKDIIENMAKVKPDVEYMITKIEEKMMNTKKDANEGTEEASGKSGADALKDLTAQLEEDSK